MLVTLVFAMVCVATSIGNTCIVDQPHGKCIDVDHCSTNGKDSICIDKVECAGTSVAGECRGTAHIQCRINSGSFSSGSSAGLCGSYADATVSPIAGNGSFIYSVVKIKQGHLSTPSSFSMVKSRPSSSQMRKNSLLLFLEPMTTNETPLIVAEKRALEEELHTLKMSFYDRREADTEIESFKQTIKQLEEKIEQSRNEYQDLYKQKHEYTEEQIARTSLPPSPPQARSHLSACSSE